MLKATAREADRGLLRYKYPYAAKLSYEGREQDLYVASIVLAALVIEGLVAVPVVWRRAGFLRGFLLVPVAAGLWIGRRRCVSGARRRAAKRMRGLADAINKEWFGDVELSKWVLFAIAHRMRENEDFASGQPGAQMRLEYAYVQLPLHDRAQLFDSVEVTRSAEVTEVLMRVLDASYTLRGNVFYRSSGRVLRILVPVNWKPGMEPEEVIDAIPYFFQGR